MLPKLCHNLDNIFTSEWLQIDNICGKQIHLRPKYDETFLIKFPSKAEKDFLAIKKVFTNYKTLTDTKKFDSSEKIKI